MDTLTNYSKFFMSLDKSDPFEIRRKLDYKSNKIKNLDSKSMQKREFTLLVIQKFKLHVYNFIIIQILEYSKYLEKTKTTRRDKENIQSQSGL